MVKKIAIALLYAAFGSTLYASDVTSDTRGFIGIEAGYTEVQGNVGYMINDQVVIEENFIGDNEVEYGFRIGAQNDEWRAAFIFDYYDSKDNDQNYEKGFVTIDYFPLESDSAVRPYIGGNIGYANYESSFVEDSGMLYGAQGGIVVEAGEMINLDLGYRYQLSDTDALDHIGSIVFGISYIF